MHKKDTQLNKEKGPHAVSSLRKRILTVVWFKELFNIEDEPD